MSSNTMLLKLKLNDPNLIKGIQQSCETYYTAGYELKAAVPVVENADLLLIFQRPVVVSEPAKNTTTSQG